MNLNFNPNKICLNLCLDFRKGCVSSNENFRWRKSQNILHAMRRKIKEWLNKMEANGIITEVIEQTEYESSMVVAKKKEYW